MDRPRARPLSRRCLVLSAGVASGILLGGCGRLPFQPPSSTALRLHRVGYLSPTPPASNAETLRLLRQGLGELGYVEGQTFALEYRSSDGDSARMPALATELVNLPVEVIVVPGETVTRVVREVSATVPIVQAMGGDLVAAGLAASYARPGGNVTGVIAPAELEGKRLQLLKQVAPVITRVAVFWYPTIGPFPADAWSQYAQAVGVAVEPLAPSAADDIDAAFAAAADQGADALLVTQSPVAASHRQQVIELAARRRWPAIYYRREYVDDGGLMSYTANLPDLYRRAAAQVDKILRGTSPAEIPIEQPMRFDFVVNMPTAQMLGLTLPREIMLQVTEVIA